MNEIETNEVEVKQIEIVKDNFIYKNEINDLKIILIIFKKLIQKLYKKK